MKKYIPGLVWYQPFETFAYALVRVSTGALVLSHGIDRLFYSGISLDVRVITGFLSPTTIGIFEVIGGAFIILGLMTRPAALLIAIEWLIIALAIPIKPGTSWLTLGTTSKFPAFVCVLCIAFIFRGGGRYSIDRMLGKEI